MISKLYDTNANVGKNQPKNARPVLVWRKPIETKTNSVWVKPIVEAYAVPKREVGQSFRGRAS